MENAAKALVIAGAILISILLISMGMMVMNSTSQVQDIMQGQMDAAAIQSFNARIEGYVSQKTRGSTVKNLISYVQASNKSYPDDQVKIFEESTDKTDVLDTYYAEISNTARYSITVQKRNEETGLISEIVIKKVSGGSSTSTSTTT